jgi:uncharacterized protein (DUF486 family)
MDSLMQSRLTPIVLLVVSNLFMTFAWYGHLRYSKLDGGGLMPLWKVVLLSWGIAFFEYIFMVPANRWGSASYSTAELKIIQEVVTLLVFTGFAALYLREKLQWNHIAAFACIIAAVAFTFLPKKV